MVLFLGHAVTPTTPLQIANCQKQLKAAFEEHVFEEHVFGKHWKYVDFKRVI